MEHSNDIAYDIDPRITKAYIRRVSGLSGDITLVGVVHDHPSSTYRVREILRTVDPDILALELPPISLPLFKQYAKDEREPPLFGGEMSAAIQTADVDTIVGIDRPTIGFVRRLAENIIRNRPSSTTVRNVLTSTAGAAKHALVCRVAASVAARTAIRLEVDFPITHDIDSQATAKAQARHERKQVKRSKAFMNAFQSANLSRASQFEDAVRESQMADELTKHSKDGEIVAVVGINHLDPLAERLAPTNE